MLISRKPVCVTCEVEYMVARNGVEVVYHTDQGPTCIVEADELECPGCGTRIIVGFGYEPWVKKTDYIKDLSYWHQHLERIDDLRRDNYVDLRTKHKRQEGGESAQDNDSNLSAQV